MLVTPEIDNRNRRRALTVAGLVTAGAVGLGVLYTPALLCLVFAPLVYVGLRRRCWHRLALMRDGRRAGTITFLQPEFVGDLPRGLGAHDFGLKDLFAAAALLGRLPRIHLYTIAVEEVRPMCTELSTAVAAMVPALVRAVHMHATRLAGAPS